MLTASQFQHWCASLHLSQETSQVLLVLRASPPVRRVGSRASNVSGAYASRKMGCTIQFESHKVEFTMIAQGHLYVDLDAMPLIEHEAVRLYLNRATAEAHALLLASSVRATAGAEAASLTRHLALSANMRVLWDGRIWILVNLGQTRITLRSEEDMFSESLGDHDGANPSHPIARRFQPDLR